jgi:hypothetical protein
VKFELTEPFLGDRDRLTADERRIVARALPRFVEACERVAIDPAAKWPDSLRVKDVEGAPGIFEVTFSFAGPSIRATFEWTRIDGARAVRWRRIGGHEIVREP